MIEEWGATLLEQMKDAGQKYERAIQETEQSLEKVNYSLMLVSQVMVTSWRN